LKITLVNYFQIILIILSTVGHLYITRCFQFTSGTLSAPPLAPLPDLFPAPFPFLNLPLQYAFVWLPPLVVFVPNPLLDLSPPELPLVYDNWSDVLAFMFERSHFLKQTEVFEDEFLMLPTSPSTLIPRHLIPPFI